MDMTESIQAIERFLARFYDPELVAQITRISITENIAYKFLSEFQKGRVKKQYQKMELYHSTQNLDAEKQRSIFEDGLFAGSARNKGYGVYLASHANYSAKWGCGPRHVFVCDVWMDPSAVTKHISEIYSPKNNWEYVVKNKHLIFPKYLLQYEMRQSVWYPETKIFTNEICAHCPSYKHEMSEEYRKCDCAHLPLVETENILFV